MRGRRHALPLASVNAAQPALRTLPTTARRATLRRALGLLADFRYEQPDPARFYHHLAADTAQLIAAIVRDTHGTDLSGARILDVGGGPGYFAAEFARRKAHYITVEPDAGEMSAAGITVAASVRGSGDHLPIATNSLDVAYSSNVAEHVAHPWALGDEMLRVTRPGGLVIYSYTVWLGPFGGHETGLWQHYVGGDFARDRYTQRHGHPPKNVYGQSLFALSCAAGLDWARQAQERGAARILGAFPRYHPWWAWWVARVPGLREVATSNLVLVLEVA